MVRLLLLLCSLTLAQGAYAATVSRAVMEGIAAGNNSLFLSTVTKSLIVGSTVPVAGSTMVVVGTMTATTFSGGGEKLTGIPQTGVMNLYTDLVTVKAATGTLNAALLLNLSTLTAAVLSSFTAVAQSTTAIVPSLLLTTSTWTATQTFNGTSSFGNVVTFTTATVTETLTADRLMLGAGVYRSTLTNTGNLSISGTGAFGSTLTVGSTVTALGFSGDGSLLTNISTQGIVGVVPTVLGGTGKNWSLANVGDLPHFSATGVMSVLATGSSGSYLKANGAGNAPNWQTFSYLATTNTWTANQIYQSSITVSIGTLSVSTSVTSGLSCVFAGAFDTLPTSGYGECTRAYQRSDHTAYISTEAVVGSQSWRSYW